MPFKVATSRPPNPPVRIFFHGLLLLRASFDEKLCFVETHRSPGHPHTLSIEVRAKMPQGPDVIFMRYFGLLEAPGLQINVDPAPASPLVHKYQPEPYFDPVIGLGDPNDFRWIINLEGPLFPHPRQLEVDTTMTRPGITIGNGSYYFYTAQRRMRPITRIGGNQSPLALHAIASIIAADLHFDDGSAVLTWSEKIAGNLVPRRLELDKPEDSRISYEIYIDNSPLFEPEGSITHSELVEYYRVIPNIFGDERFNLIYPRSLAAPDDESERTRAVEGSAKFNSFLGSPTIPCQAVVLERGN